MADYSFETWNNILATNLTGVFLGMKYEIPLLIKNNGGVILNIGSALGLVGYPKASAYSATKHAIIGLTKSAAFEYGKLGIRINVACLGGIATEMDEEFYKNVENPEQVKKDRLKSYALGTFGTPEQAAKSCVWLCSDDASFITAAAVPITGGKGSI